MLIYEHERTEQIVARLLAAARSIRSLCIVAGTLLAGGLGILVGGSISADLGIWIGLMGAIIGAALGSWLGALAIILLEWLAQMLVAQGELLATQKGGR